MQNSDVLIACVGGSYTSDMKQFSVKYTRDGIVTAVESVRLVLSSICQRSVAIYYKKNVNHTHMLVDTQEPVICMFYIPDI